MTQFLSPAGLVQLFGRRAAVTHSSLSVLSGLLASQQDPAAINQWAAWQQVFQQAVGIPLDKLKLSQRQLYGLAEGEANLSRWLFAVQTYYALIVKLLAYRTIVPAMTVPMSPPACARFLMNIETGVVFHDAGIANFLETRDIFSWYLDVWTPALATQLTSIITRIAERQLPPTRHMPRDLLQQLYQDLLPPSLRHRLGEYYTPSWLATYLLDRIGYHGDPNTTLLDPSCGSGVFLACALNRLRQHGPDSYSGQIVGFDLNPLAVLSTRANYLLMLGNDAIQSPHHIPVYQMDTILDTPPENRRYDYVVGNPPWVNWQSLMPSYREKTRTLWHHYRLFPHRDFESILGKGKKDLSLLMTMVALDCYLAETGRLGFVITAAVFKTAAGQGFREFGQGQGTPIEVIAVDDLSTIKPFAKAQNRTALVILGKGGQTTYPVPYTRWRLKPGAKRPSPAASLERVISQTERQAEVAVPINPQVDHSPWMTGPPTLAGTLQRLMNPADYRGYEGVNSGGANGVYWLEILENAPEGGLRVRNLVEHSRHPLPAVTTEIEEELVYPLLRGRDVRRWTAQAEKAVLLVQDPDTQRGYREAWLQTTLPKTHAYLAEFEAVLRRRSAYRRYFQRSDAFYTMFGVGPYTLAPYKVVWRYIAKELTAAVVLPDPVTGKVLIPDHRLILVPAAGADEAHYLAACLNSTPSRAIVAAYAITTQLSTHILQHVPVPRFDQANPLHQALAQAGKQAQAATQSGEAVAPHEAKIDQLVADLWQVRATELAEMGASLRQD